jgi:hypothetical protein
MRPSEAGGGAPPSNAAAAAATASAPARRKRARSASGESAGEPGDTAGTNAEEASDAELAEDIAYLRKTWALVRQRVVSKPAGTLLHQDLSLVERVLRDLTTEATQTIRIDSREQFELLLKFGLEFMPKASGKLQHYRGERPIFDLYSVDEEIARALGRRVDLKSGGYLVVDQTEALTTIDVNTGGFVGARNFDDTIFKTNLEAAQAIARQLRLRNLGDGAQQVRVQPGAYAGHMPDQALVLPAHAETALAWDATPTAGWYDLQIGAGESMLRLAGRAEDGRPGTSDPAMGSEPLRFEQD